MLPTHRTMKNGKNEVQNDDKYEKLTRRSWIHSIRLLNRRLVWVICALSICFIIYLYKEDATLTEVTPEGNKPVITSISVIPTEDEEEQNLLDDIIQDEFNNDILTDQPANTFLFTQYPPPVSLVPKDEKSAERQQLIIDAFRHAWKGYSKDAFGKDEYRPLSHSGQNWAPGGVGLMIIDSLDTLLLMNLTDEYHQSRAWIANELDFNKEQDVNVFETTIRVLGGLLSAYHLSNNDALYLKKAVDLADRLLGAFQTESGIPYSGVVLSTGQPTSHGPSSTAEATTIQLEFKYLSHLTKDMKYWIAAERVMDRMNEVSTKTPAVEGLVPIYINPEDGEFASKEIRLGSRGDSYYEYLLKQYLQTDKTELIYRERYDHAVAGIKKHLIQKSHPNEYTFISEIRDSAHPDVIHPKMDHLVCFMGGSFVLGVTEGASIHELDPLDDQDAEDLYLGEEITRTCYEMYNFTVTGLASEIVYFNINKESGPDASDMNIQQFDRHNLLRPETIESLFLLWRMTGDEKYREWGWNIFESFEKYCKLPDGGYSALKDVTAIPPTKDDRMDTFFLAETLKYLYLLFSPDDLIPLENYVLNTEAHPLPVFTPN